MVGRTVFELFPDARAHPSFAMLERAMVSGEPVHLEEHYSAIDLWFEAQLYPDADGVAVFGP